MIFEFVADGFATKVLVLLEERAIDGNGNDERANRASVVFINLINVIA